MAAVRVVALGQGQVDGRPEACVEHAERTAHLDALAKELLRALYPSATVGFLDGIFLLGDPGYGICSGVEGG